MTVPDWLTFLLGDTTALQLVFWVLAIVGMIIALVKLWPFLKNAVQIVDALVQLPGLTKQVAAMKTQIDSIHHETHNNDGSSIKDSQDRTEAMVKRIESSVEGVHGRLDSVEAETKVMSGLVDQLTREDEALWNALDQTQSPEEDDE